VDQWIRRLLKGVHPKSGAAFSVPSFYLLYKVHKATLGFRPITGNHVWVTQPLALLTAFLLLPFCKITPSYVSDTDSFTRRLSTVLVGPHHLLVTYDIVNLYPSIPHAAAKSTVYEHLHRASCPYADFVADAVGLILGFNFCLFAGTVFQQLHGFATGVANGSEVAHIYGAHMVCERPYGRFPRSGDI
jgi:hypothetical protein